MAKEFERYMLKNTVEHLGVNASGFYYTFIYLITKPGTDQYPASDVWVEPVINSTSVEKITVQHIGAIDTFEKIPWDNRYANVTKAISKTNIETGEVIPIEQ